MKATIIAMLGVAFLALPASAQKPIEPNTAEKTFCFETTVSEFTKLPQECFASASLRQAAIDALKAKGHKGEIKLISKQAALKV
jgi:hypothetical protein